MAKRARISQATVSRLERGATTLAGSDASTISGIADAFGIPVADVLIASGVAILAGLDPDVIQAAYAIQHLSPTGRAAVLACIEAQVAKETDHES